MAEAGLALGGTSMALHSIELIYKIISAVAKVHRFKKECSQLSNHAVLLLGVLEKNKSSLKDLDVTDPLNECLTDCLLFVIECQEWGRFSVFLEVTFRNRYPKLRRELSKWVIYFNTETGV